MTIKEFARLCGCNPQTLRYYDRMNLLKPARVDEWTGYRYYNEEQALQFVKIKNLQMAGFTIDEIKELCEADDEAIYKAFELKIKEMEECLTRTKEIQQSYQKEFVEMKQNVEILRDCIREQMKNYDAGNEFGLDEVVYQKLSDDVYNYLSRVIANEAELAYDMDEDEDFDPFDLRNSPDYEVVFEKHGWNHVKEFYDEFRNLEEYDYSLLFEVAETKENRTAFANTMLGMLINDNGNYQRNIGCNVKASNDGNNHFWLLKRV